MIEIVDVGFVTGDGKTGILFVSFEDGTSVMHDDVPQSVADALQNAPTYESYYYANVKGKYTVLKR